ncbi:hypothetical protein NL513_28785, partial [Klebsiella pneumoniae]|nr:hypothetical protein [Klebsiella pneumoniae]
MAFSFAWNWKILLFIFWGDLTPGERISSVDVLLNEALWFRLLIPLILTILYVIGMPWILLQYDR